MKKITTVLLGTLALAAIVLVGVTLADSDDGYGWGRGGGMRGGPGYGMGREMMGGNWGGFDSSMRLGMMWDEGAWTLDDYAQVPADKRAKLRDLSVETQRKMVGQMSAMHELMLTLRTALAQFPVDKTAASKAGEGLDSLHKQMFDARLDAIGKAQEILGKELWLKLQGDGGFGRGPRGR